MNNTYGKIKYFTFKIIKYKNDTAHQISQQKKISQEKFIGFCQRLYKVDRNLH